MGLTIDTIARYLFYYLIFPGVFFVASAGMAVSWIDRKITARLQWRVGPPLLQPFYDIRKLLYKESIVPLEGNALIFVLAPVVSFLSIVLISDVVLLNWLRPGSGFAGDLIVVVYLFALPPIATILGASASSNPLATLGASREMKSLLSYELPFIVCLLVPVVKAHSISLGSIVSLQRATGSFAFGSLSGTLAFAAALICLQAKMGLVPFDLSEAETELGAGSAIEYSGPLLALWKLSKMSLLVVAPLFIAVVFLGGGSPFSIIVKYVLLLLAATVLRNTNPRIRIDQSVKLFWTLLAALSGFALSAAMAGY